MSVFTGGPYGRLAIMLNTLSFLNIEIIIIIVSLNFGQIPLPTTEDSKDSRMSSKFGRIRPRTAELAALEGLKISHGVLMG